MFAQELESIAVLGLGLKKMHAQKVLKDTPSVRGMISKVPHLVTIVEE